MSEIKQNYKELYEQKCKENKELRAENEELRAELAKLRAPSSEQMSCFYCFALFFGAPFIVRASRCRQTIGYIAWTTDKPLKYTSAKRTIVHFARFQRSPTIRKMRKTSARSAAS